MPEERQVTPMTQEEVLALLQTRGFEEGYQQTPLRDFWGRLISIGGEMRTGRTGGKAYAVALYSFEELEVIQSDTPFTAPIEQLEIPVSVKEKSKMGYWGKSVDKVINTGIDPSLPHGTPGVKNQNYLIGKFLHMVRVPRPIPSKSQETNQWEDKMVDCWELAEVQDEKAAKSVGSTGSQPPTLDPTAIALSLLNGKTIQQWHSEVFANPQIKVNSRLVNQIISGEFIVGLEAAGKVVKESNGMYKVV